MAARSPVSVSTISTDLGKLLEVREAFQNKLSNKKRSNFIQTMRNMILAQKWLTHIKLRQETKAATTPMLNSKLSLNIESVYRKIDANTNTSSLLPFVVLIM